LVIISLEGVAEEIQAQLQNGKLHVVDVSELKGISAVDAVISFVSSLSPSILAYALSSLKPGGFVVFYELDNVDEEAVSDAFMLNGFINSKVNKAGGYTEASSFKPNWEVGASQKLSLKRPANGVSAHDKQNIWSSAAEGEDLIDEDSLLDESDRLAKPNTKADDCEVGKSGKKACKNCTCGRADAEDPTPKLTKEMIENPGVGSSCGSCGLGDAFRCAGCPYRGLPSFKVGEKITIPDNFMDDDI